MREDDDDGRCCRLPEEIFGTIAVRKAVTYAEPEGCVDCDDVTSLTYVQEFARSARDALDRTATR